MLNLPGTHISWSTEKARIIKYRKEVYRVLCLNTGILASTRWKKRNKLKFVIAAGQMQQVAVHSLCSVPSVVSLFWNEIRL